MKFGVKKIAAFISVFTNLSLTCIKFAAGIVSGSISILSEALHSMGDILASLIAFFSVVESEKPADNIHQFGHEKFEDMAGFVEAILILITAIFIIYMGFQKIITKDIDLDFEVSLPLYVMIFSVFVNLIVGGFLIKIGKKTESGAILGDGMHILADVYSSFGILLGLVLIKYTGYFILDPIIAIITGTLILRTGASLIKKSAASLLDSSLPEEDLETIKNILANYRNEGLVGVKSIKTSKSGRTKNIQLVIYLKCDTTLKDTHILCDKIENNLENELKHTNIIIHAEPDCTCSINCEKSKCSV